jgi:4'-phosphopantetheinyl transferase
MPTNPESIQVWVVCLSDHTCEAWRPLLTDSEWAKAMRFRMPADQRRCAVTRGVLKALLSRYLDLPATEIVFTENQFGKPAIASQALQFNVSHSGDYCVLAFAQESPLGVDVEQIRSQRVVDELAQRVLSPAEYARFMALPDADRKQTFFEIWTLKESVLKGIGSGLSVAPECLEISFFPDSPKLLSADTELIPDVGEWTLHSLSIGHPDYAAAIAVKQKAPSIKLDHYRYYV